MISRCFRLLSPLLAVATVGTGCGSDAGASFFREITEPSGLRFVHTVEHTGTFPLPEIMGAGCAVFDANGDGRLDLYFTEAGRCGGKGAPNRLFLRGEDGTYTDATAASGLGDEGYGMGVAAGDLDNDGDLDIYVGNDGRDAVYRNDGGGKFTNVTQRSGITAAEWTTSVALLDFDLDGWLDVFVVNYVKYDPNHFCSDSGGRRSYCNPRVFEGVADRLYRNRGDGTFEDVSRKAGVSAVACNGLGVIVDDFDDDGWPDVFVANDGETNHLWINEKNGTFREEALTMGVAVNASGEAEASMGVAAGDVDGDGDTDLFMTHLVGESNTLYLRESFGFVDGSMRSSLAVPSYPFTSFGTVLFDLEHDGDLDLAIANGRVGHAEPHPRARLDPLWNLYAEPNQLFLGDGRGSFEDVSAAGEVFCRPVEVTRGLAAADLDGDGDLDVVIANCKGPARVYENVTAKSGHWLQVRAIDRSLRRDVHGAVVFVHAGGKVKRRTVSPQQSYLTSGPATTHFGLGGAASVDRVVVRWPGGKQETFPGGPADRSVVLARGEGRP